MLGSNHEQNERRSRKCEEQQWRVLDRLFAGGVADHRDQVACARARSFDPYCRRPWVADAQRHLVSHALIDGDQGEEQ
jgi:hypothetical protein